ncbi:MAG TPA: methyl-coenzyme M reductase operon protein D [Methanosarcinaceae archaeon]|nr:methyl-coenzyme M reductase operon protein D [Methanosarcinaceae archaeon]
MTNSVSEADNRIQVEIFPQRLLNAETAQMLLSELNKVDGVLKALIHGPRLPTMVSAGPGTGEKVNHPDRKVVQIADTVLELSISVGRIRLEVADADVKEEVRAVCERVLPFPFEYREGLYFHNRVTVSDYAKYGPDADVEMLGLSDPKSHDPICILGSTE